MPNKKKKYSARFPPARIKKIMQKDEEVGKVAAAVPVIISRSLELFIESLIKKTNDLVVLKNAKTLTPQHIKQTVLQEKEFNFLTELVSSVPDVQLNEDDNQQETCPSLPRPSQPTSSTFTPSQSTSNLPSPNFGGGGSGASAGSAKVSSGKPRGRPKKMKNTDELPSKQKRAKRMKLDDEGLKASEDSSDDSDNDYDKTTQPPMISSSSSSSSLAAIQQQQLATTSHLSKMNKNNINAIVTTSSSSSSLLSLPANHVAPSHTPTHPTNQSSTQHPINQSLASYQLPSQLSTNEIVASEAQQPILQQISVALSSLQNPLSLSSSEIMNSVLALNNLDDDLHRQMKEQLLQQHTLLLQHQQQLLLIQQQQLQQQLQHQQHLEQYQLEQLIQSITPVTSNDTNTLAPSLPSSSTNTIATTMTTTTITAANVGTEVTSPTLNDGVLDLSKSSTSLINKNISPVKLQDGIQLTNTLFPNQDLISNVLVAQNRTLPQSSYMLNIPKVNMPQNVNIQLIQQQQQHNNINSLAEQEMIQNINNISEVGNSFLRHISVSTGQQTVANPLTTQPNFQIDGNQAFSLCNVNNEDHCGGGGGGGDGDNNKTMENN